MYATRVEVMVPFGKADAFEERAVRQGDVLQRLDGFRARRVLNALGCPAKYALLTFWESREAARVAVRGAAIRSFLEASPQPDWGTIVRPVEAYDETFTVEGQAQGQTPGQVTLIDWTLTPGQDIAEAFEQSRRNLFELHRLHNPGFLRCRL